MNAPLVSSLLVAAASVAAPIASATDVCAPHVIQSPTKYPLRSQLRGQEGTVYISVQIDENGQARSTRLQRSSGYRLLDHAATASVQDWRFDVSNCERKDLPADHVVAVEYHNDEY